MFRRQYSTWRFQAATWLSRPPRSHPRLVSQYPASSGPPISDIAWWEVTVDVAKDAALGNRTLVLVMPMGRRTLPATITIPSHIPRISDLKIVSAQSNQPTVELQFAAADESADLGDSPYTWFTIDCGATSWASSKANNPPRYTQRRRPRHRSQPAHRGWHAGHRQVDLRVRVPTRTGSKAIH